jgi:hypothetical protein
MKGVVSINFNFEQNEDRVYFHNIHKLKTSLHQQNKMKKGSIQNLQIFQIYVQKNTTKNIYIISS